MQKSTPLTGGNDDDVTIARVTRQIRKMLATPHRLFQMMLLTVFSFFNFICHQEKTLKLTQMLN